MPLKLSSQSRLCRAIESAACKHIYAQIIDDGAGRTVAADMTRR